MTTSAQALVSWLSPCQFKSLDKVNGTVTTLSVHDGPKQWGGRASVTMTWASWQ
jgi:hypothetical protein